jgi:hypothetical protein
MQKKLPNNVKHTVRSHLARIPAPKLWPNWVHYAVALFFFVAGVGMTLLWLASPWYVALIVIMLAALIAALREGGER